MRSRSFLAAGAGITSILVVGAGVTLALQQPSGSKNPAQASIDEVNATFNVVGSQLIQLAVPQVSPEGTLDVTLPIDGVQTPVHFEKHSIRGDDYVLRVQLADGSYSDVQPGPINTYRGTIATIPGARVAGSLEAEGLYATVYLPDNTSRVILPMRERFPEAAANDYLVYHGDDAIPSSGSCGVDHTTPIGGGDVEAGSGTCGGLCLVELACDADFEYYVSRGSTVTNVENRINQVMNTVNLSVYEPEVGIRHVLTTIIVRTAEPDPYSSTDAFTLLSQFRSHWLASQGGVVRDVAHLFTAKAINGSTIGIAWTIGGICTSSAYCLAQSDCCGGLNCAADLTAHELGHLWGASHIDDGNTMNSFITCALNFSSGSRTQIASHRNSRPASCLDAFNPIFPGAFNLTSPTNGSTGLGFVPTFDWGDSSAVTSYELVVDDNADFGTPVITATGLTTSTHTSATVLAQGQQYFWKVTALNDAGQTVGNPSSSTFTTMVDCNNNNVNDASELAGNDCNNNGRLDACDLSGSFYYHGQDLGPIGGGTSQSFNIASAPAATADVFLRVRSSSDLSTSSEFYDVLINGTNVGMVYEGPDSDCAFVEDTLLLPAATYNAARGAGPGVTVTFSPSASVIPACTTATYVSFEIFYAGTPTSTDNNSNNIPDECDGPAFPIGDMNCDGVVTVGDIAGFVLALTNPAGYASTYPTCDINLADINQDSVVSVGDIGPFVTLLSGG